MVRVVLFLLMGIGLAGFGVYAWRGLQHPAPIPAAVHLPPPPPPPPMASVLVAARDLRGGALLKPEDFTHVSQPAASVAADAQRDTPATRNALTGGLLRHSLSYGQAIVATDVMMPGDHGFLAATLDPGMRAFTISRDDIVADAGLIWPGDRLDLILTQTIAADAAAGRRVSAETILTDVRVLAIDQQLVQGASAERDKSSQIAEVTVEVSPAGADRLAVALRLGKLVLTVRPFAAPDDAARSAGVPWIGTAAPATATATATATVWSGDVMRSLNGPTDGRGAIATVHVFSGADAQEFRF